MKHLSIALLLVSLLSAVTAVFAQSIPTVEIVLSQTTAQPGDIITADVVIRNAVNIGGADVGVRVDDACLKIIERRPGGFLPTKSEEGGFSPFSELNEHDTRLAAAIIDRSKLANGDGVFYQVELEVICEIGEAPLSVSFAEFSAYEDPAAIEVTLVAYTLRAETVKPVDTQLTIGPAAQATTAATEEPAPTATATPAVSTDATPVPITETQAPQSSPVVPIAVICLVSGALLALVLLVLYRRRRADHR